MASLWLYWIGAAVVFGVLEMALPYFGFLFVAIAALVTAYVSTRTPELEIQGAAFVFALLGGMLVLRPRIVRFMQSKKNLPGRTEQLIGKTAVVLEALNDGGLGRVEFEGHDWAAKSASALEVGTKVEIIGADGIVLLVRRS
jgi:membrane protein implicated in regulation of membrane protease activity